MGANLTSSSTLVSPSTSSSTVAFSQVRCPYCDQFVSIIDLIEHLTYDLVDKPHKCDTCHFHCCGERTLVTHAFETGHCLPLITRQKTYKHYNPNMMTIAFRLLNGQTGVDLFKPELFSQTKDNFHSLTAVTSIESEFVGTPICGLPDDALIKIFTYITHIPSKISLEQVCKRFHYLSPKYACWKGIDNLDMKLNGVIFDGLLPDTGIAPIPQKSAAESDGYDVHNIYFNLNGSNVPFEKWPKAIELLLQRTIVRSLSFSVFGGLKKVNQNVPLMPFSPLLNIFEKNAARMKIKSIKWKINFLNHQLFDTGPILMSTDLLKYFLLIASPFLQEFSLTQSTYFLRGPFPTVDPSILPLVQQCAKLQSITMNCNGSFGLDFVPATCLDGKELKLLSLSFKELNPDHQWPCMSVIDTMKNGKIECLSLSGSNAVIIGLQVLHQGLSDTAREALEYLTIDNVHCAELSPIFGELHLIPSLFPNLQSFNIAVSHSNSDRDNKPLLITKPCIRHFFEVASNDKIGRKISIYDKHQCLANGRYSWEPVFRSDLVTFCQRNHIKIEFEGIEESTLINWNDMIKPKIMLYHETWAILSKGNASIRIRMESGQFNIK